MNVSKMRDSKYVSQSSKQSLVSPANYSNKKSRQLLKSNRENQTQKLTNSVTNEFLNPDNVCSQKPELGDNKEGSKSLASNSRIGSHEIQEINSLSRLSGLNEIDEQIIQHVLGPDDPKSRSINMSPIRTVNLPLKLDQDFKNEQFNQM